MGTSPLRSERGLTRLESSLITSLVIVVLAVAAVTLVRSYVGTQAGQVSARGSVQASEAPVPVSVAAAGTIATETDPASGVREDACPGLRGSQRRGFDCALPMFAPALDLSAVPVKGRYQCADPIHYRLVNGQSVQSNKKCVLKATKAGPP